MRDGAAIAATLGGRRAGKGWAFCCPCHADRTASCSIRDDGLVTCFAGCERREVYARLDELGFPDDEKFVAVSAEDIAASEAQRITEARRMWDDAVYGGDHQTEYVAYYLKSRGVILPVPPVLRRWKRGFIARLINLDGSVTAVHTKESYGKGLSWGVMKRGAVQLAPPRDGELGLAESIFDALSATQLTGVPCWAVCGAPRLDRIDLPDGVERVTIFSDNDEVGREAAQNARREYRLQGCDVRIWPPPGDVKDWNDHLRGIKP